MPDFNADEITKAMVSPRWSALVRTDADVRAIKTWDSTLLRDSRVLVPMDVQALYVPPDSPDSPDTPEHFVRLPFVLTAPDGQPPESMPAPFTDGAPRPPGVHLHWALPDALLRGTLQDRTGQPNRLDLPALPDRWVVLRLIAPGDALTPYVRGWVIEADTARVTPLESWTGQPDTTQPQSGRTLTREELNGSAGGSIVWTAGYDASAARFALHDPLDDLAQNLPGGAFENLATYLVSGWWSDPALDPLDGAQTTTSLHARLGELGWALTTDAEGGDSVDLARTITAARREAFLPTADRYTVRAAADQLTQGVGQGGPADRARAAAGEPARAVEDRMAMLAEPVKAYQSSVSVLADAAASVIVGEPRWPRSALLHGAVHGVPVGGGVVADARPDPSVLGVAFGHSNDDVAATLVGVGLGADTPDERRGLERVLSAFTGQLLSRLGTSDGLVDVEEHEHSAGFASLPGGDGGVERVTLGAGAGPFDAGRAARSAVARTASTGGTPPGLGVEISWAGRDRTELLTSSMLRAKMRAWQPAEPDRPQRSEVREIRRPAPRYFRPIDPMVALRGPRRSLRHQGDSRFSSDGRLFCRWPSQVPQGYAGLIDGSALLPTLSSGAVPSELVTLAREALTQSPYLWKWLAEVAAAQGGVDSGLAGRRIVGEVALRYGTTGVYDGSTPAFAVKSAGLAAGAPAYASTMTGRLVADELRRFSLVQGVDASPVAVTTWAQPWIPMWLEWEAETALADRFDGWTLGAVDLEPPAADATPVSPDPVVRKITGRAPLHAGTATVLAKSIEEWAKAEDALDKLNQGEADETTEALLSGLADAVEQLDIVTAGLDGMRDQLLGLPVDDGLVRPRVDGALAAVTPTGPPQLLVAGSMRLTRARIVDAFGRTLDVPVEVAQVPARDEVPPAADEGTAAALRIHPRIPRPSRWLFRLVDAADLSDAAREATIDQSDPLQVVNPVAGFLLPDHIDEALELFDVAGQPLGQLMGAPVGGGVMWEIAPGRQGPADSGPLHDLAGAQLLLGHVAAGMVAADAVARKGLPVGDGQGESALAALLRAIDSTLWTVDTFASMGTEHIAGLVGRPIAVVRATLRLDVDDDLDELDLSDETVRLAREAAYRGLADRAFPVRIGELTRSDDGTLAFFVDDDYTTVHVVDRVVRDAALATSPWEGQLGRFGESNTMPAERAITHPYIVADDELHVHPGQVVHLTILMHPAGKVHLTSGVLPRKDLALARDWVRPGLSVIAPSARIGPVLLDPRQVRLPKISAFGADQLWTRRDTPSTWKDDPILAATQTALLPDLPHQIEEGYIRISPIAPAPQPAPPQTPPQASTPAPQPGGTP
ncbi:MAG TPA: hypothetical protein VF391_13210 [Dermatophilaceae bacterium]